MSASTVTDGRPGTHVPESLRLHVTPTTRPESVVRKHALDHGVPCETVPHEWYFPEPGDRDLFEKIEATRRLCNACPVRPECLQWALGDHITSGMYGGASAAERQRMDNTRQKPGRAPRRRRAAA